MAVRWPETMSTRSLRLNGHRSGRGREATAKSSYWVAHLTLLHRPTMILAGWVAGGCAMIRLQYERGAPGHGVSQHLSCMIVGRASSAADHQAWMRTGVSCR